MEDCIFCKINKNEIPNKCIYEDTIIKIILNIDPNTNGHLLVLPKKHVVNINDIESDIITHSHKIIKEKIYPLLKEKLDAKGLTIAENNELGQEIRHFHIHLISRYDNDNFGMQYNKDILLSIDEIFNRLNK